MIPAAWMRVHTSPGDANWPPYDDGEFSYGADRPDGEGWEPLYRDAPSQKVAEGGSPPDVSRLLSLIGPPEYAPDASFDPMEFQVASDDLAPCGDDRIDPVDFVADVVGAAWELLEDSEGPPNDLTIDAKRWKALSDAYARLRWLRILEPINGAALVRALLCQGGEETSDKAYHPDRNRVTDYTGETLRQLKSARQWLRIIVNDLSVDTNEYVTTYNVMSVDGEDVAITLMSETLTDCLTSMDACLEAQNAASGGKTQP